MNKGRKISGAKYHRNRKSRLYEKRGQERHVTLGEVKRKVVRRKGGTKVHVLLNTNEVNVLAGKHVKKTTITNVAETPQNKFLARQNRLMKGAIIETPLGKARISNRPSREGVINAILISS
jgi:small subunit ribosomal protein S8e